jgi:hypothetical protein
MLGTVEPGDEELRSALAASLAATPCPPELVSRAWRVIESMDVGPVAEERLDTLTDALFSPSLPQLPLLLPTGAIVADPDAATLAGEALALRALTKGHRQKVSDVRRKLDDLARRGPGFDGATKRASALHGIAADAVHYPTAVTKLVAELAAVQRHDGTWGEHHFFHVAQALLAVEHPDATAVLRRGAEALATRQEADGGFGSEERSWIACRWLVRVGG